MNQLAKLTFASLALLVSSYPAYGEIVAIQTQTVMPLIDKIVFGQVLSSLIIGASAISCCRIISKKK
jgi:hypothetical protein